MSILDTFVLLFKTDSNDAVSGIKKIDAAQEKLQENIEKSEEKNKKHTEEKRKVTKENEKAAKDTIDYTKKTQLAHEELGKSILGTAAKLAAPFGIALGAWEIFSKTVGTGIDVTKMNSGLELMSGRTHQTVQDLAAVNALAKQFGGSGEEGGTIAEFLYQNERTLGRKNILDYLKNVQTTYRNSPPEAQATILSSLPPALASAIQGGDIDAQIASLKELTKTTQEATQAAREFDKNLSELGTTIQGKFTQALTPLLGITNDYIKSPDTSHFLWDSGTRLMNDIFGKKDSGSQTSTSASGNLKQSMAYWLSRGLSPDQAAGLVANEQAESGGNPLAIGDSGQAAGAFQWHLDRRAKILQGTGIDVETAGHEKQLEAAEWELKQRGNWAGLMQTHGAENASAYITKNFEIPANMQYEIVQRAIAAAKIFMDNASVTGSQVLSGNTKTSMNIKIDSVNIHTAATDADGIARHVASALNTHIKEIISNNDDNIVA